MKTQAVPSSLLARGFAVLALVLAGAVPAFAQQGAAADPPARVGSLTDIQGSVVYAPPGETEWTDAARNRPITRGDRLWTDEGARAEVHFGTSVVHMDGRTFLEAVAVDSDAVQLQVNEGTVNARVRELQGGENFEIDTPNVAFRASTPGDWRIDVDTQQGTTRVAVRSGTAVVYGGNGGVQQLVAGQAMAFAGRDLAQVATVRPSGDDTFDRWAMDRNRAEDRSVTAQYVPRQVVGYQELDPYGTWSQDADYGTVWYPRVTAADWAPYRYGHWDWIAPWGWTWIDDAPWGFAPFHYGRWAMVGARWCWVPGAIGPRPVYAPALVAFVGGDGFGLTISSGPGIAWYPLAPGEVWRPFFNASPMYVRNVNRYLVTQSRYYNTGTHYFMRRPDAITAVRVDDFNRGRPVQHRWSRINANDVARVQPVMPPAPQREARREQRQERHEQLTRLQPPVQRFATPIPPATPRPQGVFQAPVQPREWAQQREQREQQRQAFVQQREHPVRDQQVRQQQWREQQQQRVQQQQAMVQQQRFEAVRQQHEAVRQQQEAGRQQAWMQREQQRAAVMQQRAAPPPQAQVHAPVQMQQMPARAQREERQVQRQAQRGGDDDGRGRGHWRQ